MASGQNPHFLDQTVCAIDRGPSLERSTTLRPQYNGYMTLVRYALMANSTIQHAVQSRPIYTLNSHIAIDLDKQGNLILTVTPVESKDVSWNSLGIYSEKQSLDRHLPSTYPHR